MNERIKELADQCTSYNNSDGWLFDKEKFAELIIGHATECVRDVLREEDSPLTYDAADMVQKRINRHFGVE